MKTKKIVCPDCLNINTVAFPVDTSTVPCVKCQADLDNPFSLEVTDESALIHIKENDIAVLLDFYSTTCGPCMSMFEAYEDAALGFGLSVRFLKINADEQQAIAREYGVRSLPTIIAFKKGEEINRISAALSQVELTLWAEKLL